MKSSLHCYWLFMSIRKQKKDFCSDRPEENQEPSSSFVVSTSAQRTNRTTGTFLKKPLLHPIIPDRFGPAFNLPFWEKWL